MAVQPTERYISHTEAEALIPNRILRVPWLERSFAMGLAALLGAVRRVVCAVRGHDLAEQVVIEQPAIHIAAWDVDLPAARWTGTWCGRCGYQP